VEKMYANYLRWLETADQYLDYWGYPEQGRREIYGPALSDEILKKVYLQHVDGSSAHYNRLEALGSEKK
jgi:hypothetical protein